MGYFHKGTTLKGVIIDYMYIFTVQMQFFYI